MNDCGCRKSDAWRCAVDRNLTGQVSCRCACHKLPAVIEPVEARPLPGVELPDFGPCDDATLLLLRRAYEAGIQRGWQAGLKRGKELGSLASGSDDASFQAGYAQGVADTRRFPR